MIDFPIGELMDETASLQWLERHLYPAGLCCPRCSSRSYRAFRPTQAFPGYRCRDCDGAFTILTGTAFEKSRQKPSTIVLFLRGVAQGETTARLSRELSLSYKQALTLRHRVQNNANETAPLDRMGGQHFEADEVYQNAGEKN
jgi:transposase-like protein